MQINARSLSSRGVINFGDPIDGRRGGGTRRPRSRFLKAFLASLGAIFLTAGTLTGCSETPTGSSLCPADLLTVTKPASAEVTGLLDFTGSFDNTSEEFLRQIDAIVATATDSGAALRIMTFAGASSSVETLMLCRTTVPDANSDAAAASIRDDVRDVLVQAAREKVAAAPPGEGGSDIWGAWAAYAQAERLADDRFAIMLTDGQQTFRSRPPLDLADVHAEMWDIGRLRDGDTVSSEKAAAWVKAWDEVLRNGGASDVEVSSGEFQGVAK
jgi:hypothetical protein